MLELNEKERTRKEIIDSVINKKITQKEAALKLEITDRQIRRLKAELRHENINTIDEANSYLNNVFIPKMNKRFSYDINPNKNMMRSNNYSTSELNILISIRTERTIDNASSIKYFNHYYLPINDETGEVMSFKCGTKCNVVNSYNNKLYGIIDDNIYSLLLVEQQENNNQRASKNGYKTSANNPWHKFKINY